MLESWIIEINRKLLYNQFKMKDKSSNEYCWNPVGMRKMQRKYWLNA